MQGEWKNSKVNGSIILIFIFNHHRNIKQTKNKTKREEKEGEQDEKKEEDKNKKNNKKNKEEKKKNMRGKNSEAFLDTIS